MRSGSVLRHTLSPFSLKQRVGSRVYLLPCRASSGVRLRPVRAVRCPPPLSKIRSGFLSNPAADRHMDQNTIDRSEDRRIGDRLLPDEPQDASSGYSGTRRPFRCGATSAHQDETMAPDFLTELSGKSSGRRCESARNAAFSEIACLAKGHGARRSTGRHGGLC